MFKGKKELKLVSFILLITSLALQDKKILWFIFITQCAIFLFSKNSFIIFFKRVVFVLPALIGILFLNFSAFPIIFLKTLSSLIAMSVVTANFDIGKIGLIFKRFHIPQYLGEIFILAFRYSHTFVDEVSLIKKNLWLRGNFARKHLLRSGFLGPLLGNLFLRSLKKSEKVHQAMKLRGY